MRRKRIRPFLVGAVAAYVFAAFVLFSAARAGVLPVKADAVPSKLEANLLGSALHSAVAHQAPGDPNPMPPSYENLIAGAKTYRAMCSRCHGESRESDNTYGRSFYPPAPQLPLPAASYTDGEMFWIVKHGIRNTAMPAWGRLLSDEQIWQVITLLRKLDSLPDP